MMAEGRWTCRRTGAEVTAWANGYHNSQLQSIPCRNEYAHVYAGNGKSSRSLVCSTNVGHRLHQGNTDETVASVSRSPLPALPISRNGDYSKSPQASRVRMGIPASVGTWEENKEGGSRLGMDHHGMEHPDDQHGPSRT